MNNPQRSASSHASRAVTLFVEDYVTSARIGIYQAERTREQRVRISISVRVENCAYPYAANNVLDYNLLRDGVRAIIEAGHIEYQETFCEDILSMCLAMPRVSRARVKVAKLDAFPDCTAVGCEIERSKMDMELLGLAPREMALAAEDFGLP